MRRRSFTVQRAGRLQLSLPSLNLQWVVSYQRGITFHSCHTLIFIYVLLSNAALARTKGNRTFICVTICRTRCCLRRMEAHAACGDLRSRLNENMWSTMASTKVVDVAPVIRSFQTTKQKCMCSESLTVRQQEKAGDCL